MLTLEDYGSHNRIQTTTSSVI